MAVDGSRVVVAGGGKLRALGLDDGRTRWTATLPAEPSAPLALANGVVHAATQEASSANGTLTAYRALDGTRLWQRRTDEVLREVVALENRVYAVESGDTLVARDTRTGEVVARSAHPCPHLIGGDGRLVCTETAAKAGDIFEPVTLVDPVTLQVVRTLLQPLDKPTGGMISHDRLLLHTTHPEDGSLTASLVVDLDTGATVWQENTVWQQVAADRAVLAGDRVLWVAHGRLNSTDLAGGPGARPRTSPKYPEAAGDRHPVLTPHGQHVIVASRGPRTLRSVPLP
jgi:outer membrane protein assembly factor BamB